MNELITLKKYLKRWDNPQLIILVLHNDDLTQVSWEMQTEDANPVWPTSQDVESVDYAAWAELLGFTGIRITADDQVADAWDQAFANRGVTLIDAHTSKNVPPLPPHITAELAKNTARALLKSDPNALNVIRDSAKALFTQGIERVQNRGPSHEADRPTESPYESWRHRCRKPVVVAGSLRRVKSVLRVAVDGQTRLLSFEADQSRVVAHRDVRCRIAGRRSVVVEDCAAFVADSVQPARWVSDRIMIGPVGGHRYPSGPSMSCESGTLHSGSSSCGPAASGSRVTSIGPPVDASRSFIARRSCQSLLRLQHVGGEGSASALTLPSCPARSWTGRLVPVQLRSFRLAFDNTPAIAPSQRLRKTLRFTARRPSIRDQKDTLCMRARTCSMVEVRHD